MRLPILLFVAALCAVAALALTHFLPIAPPPPSIDTPAAKPAGDAAAAALPPAVIQLPEGVTERDGVWTENSENKVPSPGHRACVSAIADTSADPSGPQVAFLTAGWCGACAAMTRETLPAVREMLAVKHMPFREIDVDRDPAEAERLFAGGERTLPQLVKYTADPNCETLAPSDAPGACTAVQPLERIVGRHTAEEIKTFLDRERAKQDAEIARPRPAADSVRRWRVRR